jgi:hypothetical protein
MLQILRADSLLVVGSLLVALTWLRRIPLPHSPRARDDPNQRSAGQALGASPVMRPKAKALFGYLLLFYPLWGAFGAMWTAIFLFLAQDSLGALPRAGYVVTPEPYFAVWFMPGLLLGIQCAAATIDLSLGALMGRQYYEHPALWRPNTRNPRLHECSRHGLAVFALLLLPLILGYVTLFIPWNARFEEGRVKIHDFWAFREQSYAYDDIDIVVQVSHRVGPAGDVRPHPMIYVFFHDGRRWCDEDYGTRPSEYRAADEAFLAFLCKKSGRPLTRVQFITDVAER